MNNSSDAYKSTLQTIDNGLKSIKRSTEDIALLFARILEGLEDDSLAKKLLTSVLNILKNAIAMLETSVEVSKMILEENEHLKRAFEQIKKDGLN